MRGKLKVKRPLQPDDVYDSVNVTQFINYVMKDGRKSAATKVVHGMLEELKEKHKVAKPAELFDEALENVSPVMEVRSRRIGGATYQVPREVRTTRRTMLGMRWIIAAADSKSGKPMSVRLANEIIEASKKEGEAFKKKENTHKMAEANRAFAHFSW